MNLSSSHCTGTRHRRTAALLACLALAIAVPAVAGTGPACVAPPAGMIAWYPAERHSDDAASFFNGTRGGNAGFVAGHVGEAFAFDGTDDIVGTSVLTAEMRRVRTFTYELWARPTAALPACAESNNSNCSGSDLSWAIFPNNGEVEVPSGENGLAAGVGIAIGTNGICVGEHAPFLVDCLARLDTAITGWTHIVAVVENRTPRIYVDGVLRRTGVASAKSFVFASWQALGSGLALGEYAGELDEVTIYDRALTDAEIAALFAAGSAGKCRAACATERTNDAWQGAAVTSTTGLSSTAATDMFGGTQSTPEPGATLFADGQPDGTVHSIDWSTATPVILSGFALAARHEPASSQRGFRRFRLLAAAEGQAFQVVYESPVVLPYAPASASLAKCVNLRPRAAQHFQASFTQDGAAGFSGPRVLELDAAVLADLLYRDGFEDPPANGQ